MATRKYRPPNKRPRKRGRGRRRQSQIRPSLRQTVLVLLEGARPGLTLAQLSQKLVVLLGNPRFSEDSLREELAAIQMAGFNVERQHLKRGWVWRLGERHQTSVSFTEPLEAGEYVIHALGRNCSLDGPGRLQKLVRQILTGLGHNTDSEDSFLIFRMAIQNWVRKHARDGVLAELAGLLHYNSSCDVTVELPHHSIHIRVRQSGVELTTGPSD